jgi:hypothetical protein
MSSDPAATTPESIVADLIEARGSFQAAVADVDPALLEAPGMVGTWSAKELIAHLGYWCGHATEAIHMAEQGRLPDFEPEGPQVEERNATVARVARETDLATVQARETAAAETLIERLRTTDPTLLLERDAGGDTLESALRDDGPDHYREHVADLRAWFSGAAEPDADEAS